MTALLWHLNTYLTQRIAWNLAVTRSVIRQIVASAASREPLGPDGLAAGQEGTVPMGRGEQRDVPAGSRRLNWLDKCGASPTSLTLVRGYALDPI